MTKTDEIKVEQVDWPEYRTPQINALLAEAAGRIEGIAKTEQNKEQGFMFRSIDAITGAAKPVFRDLGISITPSLRTIEHHEVTSRGGARGYRTVVVVDYELAAPDGSARRAAMAGEAIDYGDKSTMKAEQMAFKYLLTEVLLVGTGGEDPDSESHDLAEPVTAWHWLYRQLNAFDEWQSEERMSAVSAAAEALGIKDPNVMDATEAEAMLAHIKGQYESR